LSGEVQTGPRWHQARHDFLSLPVFVRPGTILAVGATDDRPDYDFAAGVTFRVYELADGATAACDVPGPGGAPGRRCRARRGGRQVDITVEGRATSGWKVQLAGAPTVGAPAGATVAVDPLGAIITAAAGATSLRLTLPEGG
jgi:alpha-D-xyloside xylohydrolase